MGRLAQGLKWGATATVVMGTVSLLMLAVGLWPLEQPLAVVAARKALGDGAPRFAVLALAGTTQLAYGALGGALLTALAAPVTLGSAVGLGLLRWFATQVVVLPALGWAEFGLVRSRLLGLATLVPHLAWAAAAGWFLAQEDRRRVGAVPPRPPPLPARQPARTSR